ncbi:MAG: sel1 repeat family protein [Rhizobiaceae bacterium]|nr:sel1 repeat family protein [Rhizobiaceae bacterium]
MPCVNRNAKFITAMLLAVLAGSSALARTTPDEARAREIDEAVAACDKGASAPLDASAKAPPVQFAELFPPDLDLSPLRKLQGLCQTAWVGMPDRSRLQLQWLRVTMAIGEADLRLLTPQVRQLAKGGSAEARFLLYRLYRVHPGARESTMMDVSRREGLKALDDAAEQGHMGAIDELMSLYRGGSDRPRDLREVVRWARRMESAPPQGTETTRYEEGMRSAMPFVIARTTLEEDGFPATETRAAFLFAERAMKAGGKDADEAARLVVEALRAGRGTSKDPVRARMILEARIETDRHAAPVLAEMLARGEGGPADGKRALALVRAPDLRRDARARGVEAGILLAGDVVGYRPQEAIRALAAGSGTENYLRLAGLLVDYHPRLDNAESIAASMLSLASERGDMALAFAKLKLSGNPQFSDEDGARPILKRLADAGNREALWLYAATQYRYLGSTSYQPTRRAEGLSDAELMALIDEGVRREEPEAFLLKAKLLRAGILYPQDDRAASDMLRQAAQRDDIEALLLLGDAYDDGLGIAKDRKKRLDAWRRAAALGSLKAKSKISHAFTFDSFDRLMTLEEGVTWRIALYNNGYGRSFAGMGLGAADLGAQMDFMGVFSGRAMEAGADAVAEAVMNGFHEAPAGLADETLVVMGKAFPREIRVAIERRLARDGFYSGSPAGHWGPEARKALADWVEAKGWTPRAVSAEPPADDRPVAKTDAEPLSREAIGRVWDKIRADFRAAKNDRQKRAALAEVNMLAQYGNIDARWALLPNYHKLDTVRRVVTAAEITRYGLDLMVEKPPSAEKVEFEVIFNTTQIYQDGKAGEFGRAVIDTIRDDARLQDPLVLGGVLKQFIFAPGACDAVLASARRAGIDRLGGDGCDEETLSALIAFAKAKGPAGIAERNRKAAAETLKTF